MIVKDLKIDGFGVWSDLELADLDAGLTLFYGENETGKTTLLEFVRSVLYGYNEERRTKFLPPVHGGAGGGTLGVETHAGKFRIRRRPEGDSPVGRLDLTSYNGTAQDVRQLKKILADLDESTFKNVFALGLGEIQELGTLSGGGAAEFLYDLAVGSGGISLTEVQRELEKSRRSIFSTAQTSQVGQLLDRRAKLSAEIERLRGIGRSYALLADEKQRLADDVARCEIEADEIRQTAGLLEAAIHVYSRWHERAETVRQLDAIGEVPPIPDETWTKLDQLRERYRAARPQLEQLRKQRAELRKQVLNLPLNKILWRQGPRIEVLAAQLGWIEQLEGEIRKLENEKPVAPTTTRRESLSGEFVKLGLTPSSAEKLSDRRVLKSLYQAHVERQEAEQRFEAAARDEARGRELLEHAAEQAKATGHARREPTTIDGLGRQVADLRKRVQLDQKMEQLADHRDEAQRRLREKLGLNQVPADPIFNLNTAFVACCLMLFAGLLLPESLIGGAWGTALTILGLIGALFAGGTKIMRDLTTNEQLESLRAQARSAESQLHELESERDDLDARLPPGAGPMLTRLQQAERELSEMEEQATDVGRRSTVRDELESVRVEYRTAQELADKAARRWQHELERHGLPSQITWSQLKAAARARGKIDAERRRVERRVKYVERRRNELALIADRVAQAFAEAQLEPQGERVSDQVRHLHAEWRRNEDLLDNRKAMHREHRLLDRRLHATHKELTSLVRRRKGLLKSLDVTTEKQLMRRRDRFRRRSELQERREALAREITLGLGQRGTEDELRAKCEHFELPQLEQRWTELCDRLTAVEKRLKELYAEQGRLEEKLAAAAADASLPRRLYELKTVERAVADALGRWQTLTVTQRLVEAVRKKYEAERQPETLREATRYFDRLTEGRYVRVWTPLEAGVLYVDTKQGERLSVDVLSRGTREQLFLALRLALVDLYARRGKAVPLVLDDVLVNFDTRRTRIAAELLCDFATDHRQLLLFTCHEHIYRLFKSLRSEVRLLPGQTVTADDGPVRTVEKIVEKIVKVKEPVYVPAPTVAPPPMPVLDGTGVFHLPAAPRTARKIEPPPQPILAAEPEYEEVVEEVLVEPAPQTILRTKRVGYPVVPLWNPATPFAEATWQETIEDDDDLATVGRKSTNGNGTQEPGGRSTSARRRIS